MLNNFPSYTVESVTAGHPDKICDRISDAVLDACLEKDPYSRVAVESFGSHGLIVIGGEVTTTTRIDYEEIARRIYRETGYDEPIKIVVNISQQSPDIALGVNTGGAGDQGIMYGYATNETPEFLPRGVVLVHQLAKGLEELRKKNIIPWLRPDGKTQVTMRNGRIAAILVSSQHDEKISEAELKKGLLENLIKPLVKDINGAEILINPTGRFIRGGFEADTGLTGRKIMVDTYGGLIPHGGGCFSGKDATKVDRSGAYMGRFAAKNLVANGYAKKCLVSVAYAIGRENPLMLEAVDEKGERLGEIVKKHFDFRPLAIIERLGLRRPIYSETSVYGHFGRPNFPWEQTIKI